VGGIVTLIFSAILLAYAILVLKETFSGDVYHLDVKGGYFFDNVPTYGQIRHSLFNVEMKAVQMSKDCESLQLIVVTGKLYSMPFSFTNISLKADRVVCEFNASTNSEF
jgi:hypothetical protein